MKNKLWKKRDVWVVLGGFLLVQILAALLVNRFMFCPVKNGYSEQTPGYADIGDGNESIAALIHGPFCGKAAVIYLHGNAEDATSGMTRFDELIRSGYTVATVDYPGYGLSSGNPTESGCYKVAHRLYNYLREERGFTENRIFVIGYSIGTGVAVELAATERVAGLWLEAPYLSAPRIITRMRLLAIDSFPSHSRIGKVNCPVQIVHGTNDRVVPFAQGKALFELAHSPKSFWAINGADHEDFAEVYGFKEYSNKLMRFMSEKKLVSEHNQCAK